MTETAPFEFDAWSAEARGMLLDALETLRTFDDFAAFRVSTATESGLRLPSTLAWDPPTSAAWDQATHITQGLYGRADQFFQTVTTASLDQGAWRQRRVLADATHTLLDVGEALSAYRNRVDRLPPGDAASALALLDKAWAQWEAAAAHWGVSRVETFSCA